MGKKILTSYIWEDGKKYCYLSYFTYVDTICFILQTFTAKLILGGTEFYNGAQYRVFSSKIVQVAWLVPESAFPKSLSQIYPTITRCWPPASSHNSLCGWNSHKNDVLPKYYLFIPYLQGCSHSCTITLLKSRGARFLPWRITPLCTQQCHSPSLSFFWIQRQQETTCLHLADP